jgi:aspartate dehydrogenase
MAGRKTKVGIAGLGAIGMPIARKLANGAIPDMELAAVASRDGAKARAQLEAERIGVPVVALAELAELSDIVIECAPAAALRDIAKPVLAAGKKLLVVSVGALLSHPDLIALAKENGAQIVVPSGALLGLDAVAAAAEGRIHSVRMVTRKPPGGLSGAPYLVANKIDVDGLSAPLRVFEGSARDAAKGFPANVNVAVALSLAGIGPDETRIEIWADPGVARNTHSIRVDSDAARFEMTIENIPSENPKTGRITPQSVIATLRKMSAPLRVGT